MDAPTVFLVFILAVFTLRAQTCKPLPNPPSESDIESFLRVDYDYVIIGGGTAGLALAARLSEDPEVHVAVLEAGYFHLGDPIVDVPEYVDEAAGNSSYDWGFSTTPQAYAGGRNLSLPRGKMLGGSSGINGMAWNRASRAEYDAWRTFAPENDWTWDGLLPFFKKSENLSLSPSDPYPGITPMEKAQAVKILPKVDGFSGPIVASYNSHYFEDAPLLVETLNAIGIPTNPDSQSGNSTGIFNTLASLDRRTGTRSYAAMGYYCDQPVRANLHILVDAQVTKIHFVEGEELVIATAVQFAVGPTSYVVNASREVILSAGTIQTPQILELSGIGNKSILEAQGIQTLVDLPPVGENFQEHLYVGVQWKLKPGIETFDILRNNATFAAEQKELYFANRTGLLAATDNTVTLIPLQSVVDDEEFASLLALFDHEAQKPGLSQLQKLQYPIQRSWLETGDGPYVELIQWSEGFYDPQPNESYIVILGGNMHPTSRGSVHIDSSDPFVHPVINPQFLSHEFDVAVLLNVLKFVQRIGNLEPFATMIAAQTDPLTNLTNGDLESYVRNSAAGGDHLIGTAAMAPRDAGGVVDSSLVVYGTANLRVVDASVIPLLIACHTQSTTYAIAEKAAEFIKHSK